jgi:hypothetical protein
MTSPAAVQPGGRSEDHAAAQRPALIQVAARPGGLEASAARAGTVPVWAVVSAGLLPVLMAAGWLTAGALQPASYSPFRQTVSVLAGHGGTDRWIMTSALFLVGGCYLATAGGMTGLRKPARLLLIVAGLASIGIAASPEPASGSTPQHLAWTVLGAVTITAWPAVAAWRPPQRPLLLRARTTVIVTVAFTVLLGWLVVETQDGTALGLAERLVSGLQVSWPFIIAVALRRAHSGGPGTQPAAGGRAAWPDRCRRRRTPRTSSGSDQDPRAATASDRAAASWRMADSVQGPAAGRGSRSARHDPTRPRARGDSAG